MGVGPAACSVLCRGGFRYPLPRFQSPRILFSMNDLNVLRFVALMPLVGASCFPNLFSKVSSPYVLQFVFENSVTILREPYF